MRNQLSKAIGPVGVGLGGAVVVAALGALYTTLQWRTADACAIDAPLLARLPVSLSVPGGLCDAVLAVGVPAAVALVLGGLGLAAGSAVASRASSVA